MSEDSGMCLISYDMLSKNTIKCRECEENILEYDRVICGGCWFETRSNDEIYELIKKVAFNNDHEFDPEYYGGFDTEKEKETYINGVKKGFSDAIFWLCDRIGYVGHFEKEIYQYFYPDEVKE